MKILLTGAKGQVAREIMDLSHHPFQLLPFSKAELDITHFQQLNKIVARERPNLIINTAGYTAVDKAEQEPELAFAVNRDGVKNCALVCKEYDIPLIHLSTDYVFDGSKESAYTEEDRRVPMSVYGASKAEGEIALEQIWEKHLILRVSWVFSHYGRNFVPSILKLATQKKELRIVSDQRGCPTAATDLAATLLRLAGQLSQGQAQWGIFHYCGDRAVTWFELAQILLEQGKDIFDFQCQTIYPIKGSEFPTLAKRPQSSVMKVEKIQRVYGIGPSLWEQALSGVIKRIHDKFPA